MRRLGGRPVYGVVGYTHDGAAYCPACAEACEDVPVEDGELTAAVWYGCEGQRYEPADTVAEAVWHLSTDDRLDLDRLDRADAREVLADRIPAEAQGGGA